MKNAAAHSLTDDEAARRADAQAVASSLSGDMTSFDRLIEKYQRRAVAVSYRLLGNIDDAMDVCQEAFVRAFRSLGSLQEPERFGAWLMRIVSNLSLNYRRGRRANLSLSMGDDEGGIEALVTDRSSQAGRKAPDSLQRDELQKAITAAIEALPEQQRLSLILFAIEQLPQKEVAEILDCSVEMVKWNVFQARKNLKQALAEYIEE
jgi:RNA polymerase sigma-70 factor, ECF subfamily